MEFKEERLSSEPIFSGYVFDVHKDTIRLHNGNVATREVVEHHGGVAILAVDSADNVSLVRQYRYGVDAHMLELPAGKLEKGESPKECGIRELTEETGYTAGSFEHLCDTFVSPAYCSEKIYIYCATELTSGEQHLDTNEFLELVEIPLTEAVEMCTDGRITDAKTVVGILTYARLNER